MPKKKEPQAFREEEIKEFKWDEWFDLCRVKRKIGKNATIDVNEGNIRIPRSVKESKKEIHLGKEIHDTMVNYAIESKTTKDEIGAAIFLKDEQLFLSGRVDPLQGEPRWLIIKREYNSERGDPEDAENAAVPGTAHTHVSGNPIPSVSDIQVFFEYEDHIMMVQGTELYSIVQRTEVINTKLPKDRQEREQKIKGLLSEYEQYIGDYLLKSEPNDTKAV